MTWTTERILPAHRSIQTLIGVRRRRGASGTRRGFVAFVIRIPDGETFWRLRVSSWVSHCVVGERTVDASERPRKDRDFPNALHEINLGWAALHVSRRRVGEVHPRVVAI